MVDINLIDIISSIKDTYKFRALWNTVTSRYPLGTNVFDHEWDLLIILDSCRVDAMKAVAPEYDFITDVDSIISVGSMSAEWMINTFTEDYKNVISNTSLLMNHAWFYYILEGQIHEYDSVEDARRKIQSDEITIMDYYGFLYHGSPVWRTCTMDDLNAVDHVWKLCRDMDIDTPWHHRPQIITDRAIDFGRTHDGDRLIVHYMLPHTPFDGQAIREDRAMKEWEKHPKRALKSGEKTTEELFEAHKNNLRCALDYVAVLLDNIDAENVVITADHGEALGEYGQFGHPWGSLHPRIKQVPWVETNGEDLETFESEYPFTATADVRGKDAEENLRALGYLS